MQEEGGKVLLSAQRFLKRANEIIDAANSRQIPIRLMGFLAFIHHCPKYSIWYEKMERIVTDIDLVCLNKHRNQVEEILISKGYGLNVTDGMGLEMDRIMANNEKEGVHIDVFVDKLSMCHEINFKNRLGIDNPTIPLADMLLEKMQIVRINEKDIKDVIILFREHAVEEDKNQEAVDTRYVAKLLAKDWGFYHTVEKNLALVKEYLDQYDILSQDDKQDVHEKVDAVLKSMKGEPKGMKWQMRAKLGESSKWYNDVEDVMRDE